MDAVMNPAVAKERVKVQACLQARAYALRDAGHIRTAWRLALCEAFKSRHNDTTLTRDEQNGLRREKLMKAWTEPVVEDVLHNFLLPVIRSVVGVDRQFRGDDARPKQAVAVLLFPSLWQAVVDSDDKKQGSQPMHVTAVTAPQLPKILPQHVLKVTNDIVARHLQEAFWNNYAHEESILGVIIQYMQRAVRQAHDKALAFSAARADFLVQAAVNPVAHTWSMAAPIHLSQYAPDVDREFNLRLRQFHAPDQADCAAALANVTRTLCREWATTQPDDVAAVMGELQAAVTAVSAQQQQSLSSVRRRGGLFRRRL
mmetsp:Transcript_18974/g.38247  ORF Transcript_18974/g.38247 Transcript_18974/m.38247 type:complete len:314 (+) Transcript_18974:369-1310(+)